jgi:chaperonin GroES
LLGQKTEVNSSASESVADSLKESNMNIQPLADRVIVRPLEAEEKTKGGIILPDTAKEKPQEGEIIAVGKGKVLENGNVQAMEVKKGDRILYGKYSGSEIKTKDGEDLLIMREEDILAIIKVASKK